MCAENKRFLKNIGQGILIFIAIYCILFFDIQVILFNLRWHLKINILNPVLYESHTDPSFNGDGDTYMILFNLWQNDIPNNHFHSPVYEKEVVETLSNMNVPEKEYPDFSKSYNFYYAELMDHSYIYVFDFTDKIYILERIQ